LGTEIKGQYSEIDERNRPSCAEC